MSQIKDIKVLELASVLAGPGVGQFFAELGAEVIKVENLKTDGDVTRSWKIAGEETDERSAYFCSVNWGKKSIALDLSTIEGYEIVRKLADRCDIIITSFKPGDAEKLRVDFASLSKNHPALIYGQITGYGSDNQRVGYDAVIQAEAGFMFINGEPGGPSLKMPVALMDILAAHQLKEGLLLAMLEKAHTGKGKLVEVSLIQAAVASLANQATNLLIAKKLPQKKGSAHPNIAPYGEVFKTADGKEILLAVGTDRQFGHLCKILKIKEKSKDFSFKTNPDRVQNRHILNPILAQEIGNFQSGILLEACHTYKVPVGVIRNLQEVFQQPEVLEIMLKTENFRGVRCYVAKTGQVFDSHLLPPPRLGEHTREILAKSLLFSSRSIDVLFQKGIVG